MAGPLLETKLFPPRRRVGVVHRARLAGLLAAGARAPLTLVSAPAGFGKTTLVADWLAGAPDGEPARSVAWLSLDAADDQPAVFWGYVMAALRRAAPDLGNSAGDMLAAGEPTETVLTALLNDLATIDRETVLVLDDFHVIGSAEIGQGVAFLIDHLPPRAHVVITTRADPPLPLPRLRARGDLVEIRAADLRFNAGEAAEYLNGTMGLGLATTDVAALEGRTEGWIAALQLAALSVQGRDDASAFIAGFAGDDRYIVDYLVEEVLLRQPDAVREFLLETSILDRLTGPLCDAVTGQERSAATLEALDRANLFVAPLDDRRQWYRYHHLFADVLQAQLRDAHPERVAVLHRRASRWFEARGDVAEAIEHALAAGDHAHAADMIELAAHDLRANRREATLRRWLDALPEDTFDTRPILAIAHVGALLATGETAHVDDRLTAAERWVPAAGSQTARADAEATGMVVRHSHALEHLPSAIALYRAAQARMRGDNAATIAQAQAALDAAGPDQLLERGGAAGMLALAHWSAGDLDAAAGAWTEAAVNLERAGHAADVLGCSIALGDIAIAQGRLDDAVAIYERGIRLGTGSGAAPLRGTADMHVGLADVLRDRNDLAGARAHLEAATELSEASGLPQNPHRSRVAMARLLWAEGDPEAAVEWLDDAARHYDGDFFPDVRPIAAVRARVLLALGRSVEARTWARDAGVEGGDALTYVREFEHATLARLLVAQEAPADAIELSERLLDAAEAGGRIGSAIDILVVLALAREHGGDRTAAEADLARALTLAAPEGQQRVFLDEGTPLVAILRRLAARRDAPAVARAVLAAVDPREPRPSTSRQPLVEPLSERELDVLRLLASDLDGPDIANELSVSLNTLRTHTRNVYAKLGVNSRRAAVSRGRELGLLA